VTPRAVVNAVRRALQFFDQNRALWANRDAD
jgi:Na+-translocating ferredoxin:NAD+ oxidoreductase RnfG subunit